MLLQVAAISKLPIFNFQFSIVHSLRGLQLLQVAGVAGCRPTLQWLQVVAGAQISNQQSAISNKQ
jgi:hypothetical protein